MLVLKKFEKILIVFITGHFSSLNLSTFKRKPIRSDTYGYGMLLVVYASCRIIMPVPELNFCIRLSCSF